MSQEISKRVVLLTNSQMLGHPFEPLSALEHHVLVLDLINLIEPLEIAHPVLAAQLVRHSSSYEYFASVAKADFRMPLTSGNGFGFRVALMREWANFGAEGGGGDPRSYWNNTREQVVVMTGLLCRTRPTSRDHFRFVLNGAPNTFDTFPVPDNGGMWIIGFKNPIASVTGDVFQPQTWLDAEPVGIRFMTNERHRNEGSVHVVHQDPQQTPPVVHHRTLEEILAVDSSQ